MFFQSAFDGHKVALQSLLNLFTIQIIFSVEFETEARWSAWVFHTRLYSHSPRKSVVGVGNLLWLETFAPYAPDSPQCRELFWASPDLKKGSVDCWKNKRMRGEFMGKLEGGSGFWMAFPQKRNLHNAHGEHLKSLALPMGISSVVAVTQTQSFGPEILLPSQLLSTSCLCSKALQHEGAVCFCSPPLRAWSRQKALLLWSGSIFPDSSASGIIPWDKMCHQIIHREWTSYSSASTTETACRDLS